ncbi:hypothetical protein L0F63_003799 [Massospora cicadina]|nr:hypothetical protein L0F63_003799 [Massospora cicadina]
MAATGEIRSGQVKLPRFSENKFGKLETVDVLRTYLPTGEILDDIARTEVHVMRNLSLTRMLQVQGSDLSDGTYIRSLSSKPDLNETEAQESFFHQPIDHHDPKMGTFKQRFLINNRFYKRGGPILLEVSSGTEIVPEMVFVGAILNLARMLNGMIIVLEQRYYGGSKPFPDLSTESLKYLTMQQSVDDVGRFVKRVNLDTIVKGKERPRWVVVGGSYGGNLAAWAKAMYPEHIYAGWISSAPIKAVDTFPQYDQQISKSLVCHGKLHQAILQLDAILKENRTKDYINDFQCQGLIPADFAWALAEVLGYLAQYSIPQRPPHISGLCDKLDGNGSEDQLASMASFYREFFLSYKITCGMLAGRDEIMDIYPANKAAVARQNFYLMCNEMGHFQIAPRYNRLRSHSINHRSFLDRFCKEPFGIVRPPDTAKTNERFGGFNINVTKLVFTTGDLDPWFHLTLHDKSNSSSDVPIYVIRGARHNSDLNAPGLGGEPPNLAKVRDKVFKHLEFWLSIPNPK